MSAATLIAPKVRALTLQHGETFSDEPLFEIIDGKRVELPPMSVGSSIVASTLIRFLGNYAAEHNMGRVVGEILIQLPVVIGRTRRPDVVFVSYEKWAKDRAPLPEEDAAWELAPELAVEVVSPSDKAEELMTKVIEYFEAGIKLVWVIYPRQRNAQVHESLAAIRGVSNDELLDGGEVLPGFKLPLSQLFL